MKYVIYPPSVSVPDSTQYERMTFNNACAALHSATFLYIDLETTGFDFLNDDILTVQMATDHLNQYVFILGDDLDIPDLIPTLESASMLVGHNIKFDLKFLRREPYSYSAKKVFDTMIVEQILVNGTNQRASLLAVVQRYCQVDLDKSVRASFGNTNGNVMLTERQILYALDDVVYLPSILTTQIESLQEHNLMKIAELECHAVLAFTEIEYNGLSIDVDRWKKQVESLKVEAIQLEIDMNTMVDTDPVFDSARHTTYQTDMFLSDSDVSGTRINWESPMEVLKVFQCIDKKLESFGDSEIIKMMSKTKLAPMMKEYREKSKKVSSFGDKFLSNMWSDGKIHPRFIQIKRTGRVSCKEPNMQQIPADNSYRNCFITTPGNVFVSADYSSQELCIIAHGSKDPVFNHALQQKHDLHSVCAELVFGQEWKDAALDDCAYYAGKKKCSCPEHKKLRTTVKSINFGLAYGMGPKKLSETMSIPMKDASSLIDKYFQAFPTIKEFLDSQSRYGVRNGCIKTFDPWGRIRWFDDWSPGYMDMAIKGRIERISKNTPIQGTAADMTKHALVLCHSYIRDNNFPATLVMTVHDQIDTVCAEENADEWAAILKKLMEEAAQHIMGNDLLKAEVEITEKWSK